MKRVILSIFLGAAFVACTSPPQTATTTSLTQSVETHVLHTSDVAQLSPDSVLSILKSGNQNFVSKQTLQRDVLAQLKESAEDGQAPLAIVLSCIDSRVPVEMIFDMGLGDLFVTRVAGNVVSTDVLGSMEYACEHAGSKVVVVLGHESCGAVHSACEGVQAGNMTAMLAKINSAIETAKAEGGDPHSAEFQNRVVAHNVNNMIENVRQGSEILAHLEAEGKIKIVGGIFNLHSGVVEFDE
ncbi:MAG: carbonic anhydrase family protein [Rikenellaceae bacterium]